MRGQAGSAVALKPPGPTSRTALVLGEAGLPDGVLGVVTQVQHVLQDITGLAEEPWHTTVSTGRGITP